MVQLKVYIMMNDMISETELKEKIEEFKRKAERPHAADIDVEQLLKACGGDVDLAVSLIKR